MEILLPRGVAEAELWEETQLLCAQFVHKDSHTTLCQQQNKLSLNQRLWQGDAIISKY